MNSFYIRMNLTNFEQQVDPKIVDRGYNYFHDGRVDGPELIDDGEWMAMVYGTESYRVDIQTDPQNSQTIVEWQCSCPYDYGPVCKHVVAALFVMAEGRHSEAVSSDTNKKSTPKDKIQEIFNNTDREDLQEFILDGIKSIDGFKNRFLAHFADRLDEDPSWQYRTIIRNYARAAQDRHGFIDYRSAPTLTRPLWELNKKANALADKGKTAESMTLCQILIEEVAVIYQKIDDSDGGAGDVAMLALDTLDGIAQDAASELKEELFEWCIQEFPLQKYHDFGFETHFLTLMPQVITTGEQEKQFFELLDRQIEREKESRWSDYGVTQLIKAKIDYLAKEKREQEVLDLLQAHIRFPDFRERLTDRALKEKEFEKARTLCREGIQIAKEQNHRGTVIRWQEKLFHIAKLASDAPAVRKWAETLFFNHYGSMQWYRALKETYSKQAWPQKCDELIGRLKGGNKRAGSGHLSTLAEIFAEEDNTGRLLKLLQRNDAGIAFVNRYTSILKEDYPYELLELYEQGILKAARQTGRKQYRQVAGWLRKMKKITGGDEQAYRLYKKLLRDYSNRPAMKDEFEKAFPQWK